MIPVGADSISVPKPTKSQQALPIFKLRLNILWKIPVGESQ